MNQPAPLLASLFRWEKIESLLSDHARVQGMLDFEAALARAEAKTGVIPSSSASAIASKCQAQFFNFEDLARSAALAGNLAIPLVKQLTALVGSDDPEAMRFVHWGATSQDAIDTGFILQLREVLEEFESEIDRLSAALAILAGKHRATLMVGRTWMQPALPTPFGFQVAGWLDAIHRHRARLRDLQRRALVLQFGGAVGTLAAFGGKGAEVARALGEELQLTVPEIPSHSHRDRIAEIASTFGFITGTLGKIARDISLQMQTEIAELSEPQAEGRGGSSTMPHKHNPVACSVVLAAAARVPGLVSTVLSAMVQEEQRGLGGWQAEWEVMPEIIGLSAGALHHLTEAISNLEVHADRMSRNLELTRGLILAEAVQMALGKSIGRSAAHELIQKSSRRAQKENRHLRDVLAEDPAVTKHLNQKDLDRLFDPREYLGDSSALIDRVLATHSSRSSQESGKPVGKTAGRKD